MPVFAAHPPEHQQAAARAYLLRLGFAEGQARALVDQQLARAPTLGLLADVVHRHLTRVPFENLSQHAHPETPSRPFVGPQWRERQECKGRECLDDPVNTSVRKLAGDFLGPSSGTARRGGFCFEVNVACAWLLEQLGFVVELRMAQVFPRDGSLVGGVPTHVVVVVQPPAAGLHNSGEAHESARDALVVDVGFADSPRAPIPFSSDLSTNVPLSWTEFPDVGDSIAVVPSSSTEAGQQSGPEAERFPFTMIRTRLAAPEGDFYDPLPNAPSSAVFQRPMYRFDTVAHKPNCPHMLAGLHHVLTDPNVFFTQKRFCVLLTPSGILLQSNKRVRWTERGRVVKEVSVEGDEEAWRASLEDLFGIRLG